MRHSRIIYAIVFVLVAFGIFALDKMNKDEFPQVTIRQGLIVAVYPGATAQEVEEQVAKPIEQYLFTFQEIDKRKTYSLSKDGMCYVFAALSQKVMNSNEDGRRYEAVSVCCVRCNCRPVCSPSSLSMTSVTPAVSFWRWRVTSVHRVNWRTMPI